MRTEIKIILMIMIVVTLALFWDDALAAVAGMTPLEVAEFLWMVTVKATVLAICAWLASTVPHVVGPWLKLVKRSQRRAWRSGPNANWQKAPKMPKLTAEERMMMMLYKMQQGTGRQQPTARIEEHEQPVEFRW